MCEGPIVIPDDWLDLNLQALGGVLLVVGAPDTGKSTFAHWLFEQLQGTDRCAAFLDGDVGQSALGPPTTMTLLLSRTLTLSRTSALSHKDLARWFVGDVSPRGHMLLVVVGAARLVRWALKAGAETVVVDTTGLVNQTHGGVALKHALVDQLQPSTLFALQRGDELEPILAPLRRLPCPRVIEFPVVGGVPRRDVQTRQAYRAEAFRRYFVQAGVVDMSLGGRAVFGGQTFGPRRLLGLQDADGFLLGLGVIVGFDPVSDTLAVCTPLGDAGAVASIRLGAIGLDTRTGCEFRPGRTM